MISPVLITLPAEAPIAPPKREFSVTASGRGAGPISARESQKSAALETESIRQPERAAAGSTIHGACPTRDPKGWTGGAPLQTLLERLGLDGAPSLSAASVDGPTARDYTSRTSPAPVVDMAMRSLPSSLSSRG